MMREMIPAEELLNKARAVGQYYGFTPLVALTMKKRGMQKAGPGYPETLATLALDPVAETIASFLKQCQRVEAVPTPRLPLFIWHTNIAPGRPAQKKATVQFHALGSDRPIADAVIIRALIALVRDLYHEEPIVRINSMGDKETRARPNSGIFSRNAPIRFPKNASHKQSAIHSRRPSSPFCANARTSCPRPPNTFLTQAANASKTCSSIWK